MNLLKYSYTFTLECLEIFSNTHFKFSWNELLLICISTILIKDHFQCHLSFILYSLI